MNQANFEGKSYPRVFVTPDLYSESGEIQRVAQIYAPENEDTFVKKFIEAAGHYNLTDLTEDVWGALENTDSFDIKPGDWTKVEEHIDHTNRGMGADRNWQDLKQRIEAGEEIDAPIILKYREMFHLVSGNTRLMVARALGVRPKVLIVEVNS